MKAPEILDRAAQHMRDRAQARDQPDGERSMLRAVSAFNALTGHTLSERDGWMFMVALKAARACTTPTGLPDDYEDGAAYFGLAGESAQNYEVIEVAHKGAVGVDVGSPGGDQTAVSVFIGGTLFAVPDVFNYVAQDSDGAVWAYESKPERAERNWVPLCSPTGQRRLGSAPVGDWRASLMELRR